MALQKRYLVYIGLFVLMFINYLDRVNLSVAAKSISETYGLTPIDMGYIFSAFLWTYLICLIPMGLLADRYGGRAVIYTTLGLWSLAGIWTGLATTYSSLFASRLVLGVGESASYPAGGKIIREWAPEGERGIASAFLNCGAHAGLCVGSVVVGSLIVAFGWRESFYITGAAGVVLALLWFALYRQPERASWLSAQERDFILKNRGAIAARGAGELNQSAALKGLLSSPSMWALALTQGCAGYTLYLFMTWLPSYLAATRGMDVLKSSLFSAIPYGVAAILGLGLGWFSDSLLKKSGRGNADRRKLIAAMLLLSSVILAAPLVDSIWVITMLISISLACVATAMAMNIALTADLMTDGRYNGAATSLLIMGGNLFGTAAPIVTGYVVATTGGYSGAFLIAGVLLLGGAVVITSGARTPIRLSAASEARLQDRAASAV
ncbi:MFS transporter [Bradyrhizobium sp. Leo121]|uniref:MFS transporter n=1 Tax=Bradyrhizobium sp. Leo121 TaxID=1571195 RepID=UPI00102A7BB7|nr:MFS transporter [Bradyrhizobium sp. Leo121]RZN17964.1 MFS transporter [Bradyrhizobium sp. Leo121]